MGVVRNRFVRGGYLCPIHLPRRTDERAHVIRAPAKSVYQLTLENLERGIRNPLESVLARPTQFRFCGDTRHRRSGVMQKCLGLMPYLVGLSNRMQDGLGHACGTLDVSHETGSEVGAD